MSETQEDSASFDYSWDEATPPKDFSISTKIESEEKVKEAIEEAKKQISGVQDYFIELMDKMKWDWMREPAVVSDALSNAVYHGNWEGSITGQKGKALEEAAAEQIVDNLRAGKKIPEGVGVSIIPQSDEIIFTVQDQGKGFDFQKRIDEAEENIKAGAEGMAESGRGIFLMIQTVGKENLRYEDGGRKLTLIFKKPTEIK